VSQLLCERLFQADSTTVLEVVEALDDAALAEARWKLAVAGMDVLLYGLGLRLTEKLAVGAAIRDRFAREHNADQAMVRQIGERFRVERAGVEAVLDPSATAAGGDERLAWAAAALRRMACGVGPVMARLPSMASCRCPSTRSPRACFHMHANRLLRSDQRRHELVLYDFLCRLCDARAARAREAATA
jgi:thiopeptide-type bacteriocin biosynthesis protein